jgi:hypothetical protein
VTLGQRITQLALEILAPDLDRVRHHVDRVLAETEEACLLAELKYRKKEDSRDESRN